MTNSAAGQYMKDDSWSWLWFHMDDVNKVMMAIDGLPRDLAGLSPSGTLLSKYSMALANMAAGAEWMVANNTLAVQEAQDAHAACEKVLQVGGAVSMATAGAEILTEEGCEAFAAAAAKQIANLAAAQLVNTAVGQSVNYLATKFNINPAYLQIGADSVQLFFLVKAAQQERIKNNARPPAASEPSRIAVARQLGIEGEEAVGMTGPKVGIQIPGTDQIRFPDAVTKTTLTEVKNIASLSYTQQLRDYTTYSQQTGRTFDLYVRPSTRLSAPLKLAIANGDIILKYIPGAK